MLAETYRYVVDKLGFWRTFLRNPRQVSAVAPSGAALAELMTSEIEAALAPIIELGPGTGVFTRRLVQSGIPQDELVLVESGHAFAKQLEDDFPDAVIFQLDARRLQEIRLPGPRQAGAIVSGLPFLSMDTATIERILAGAFGHLREDGAFYQFTYGPGCPVPSRVLTRLGLCAVSIGWVPANLPPASVYRIRRAPGAAS